MSFDQQHDQIDKAQVDLDSMDSKLDDSVALDENRAQEMTDLYLKRVDDLQDRVKALTAGGAEDGDEVARTVIPAVANYLRTVDAVNFALNADDFAMFLDEQFEMVEEVERQRAVPPEFRELVNSMEYDDAVVDDFYEAYLQKPEALRLDIDDIHIRLTDLTNILDRLMHAAGKTDLPQRDAIRAEGFSFLINGDLDGFNGHMDKLDLEAQYYESQLAVKDNEDLGENLKLLEAKAARYDRAIRETVTTISELQAENPHWAKSWREHNHESIKGQLTQLRRMEFDREFLGRDIEAKHTRVLENNAVIYGFQYRAMAASGQAPQHQIDRLLLDMSKSLGDAMPADLQDDVATAYERFLDSPDLTPYEVAYYSNDPEALSLAVDEYNSISEGEPVEDQETQIMQALETNPDITALRDTSKDIFAAFRPITELLEAATKGNATFELVHDLKARVRDLNAVYDPAAIRVYMANAKGSLAALGNLELGEVETDFEAMVTQINESLTQFGDLVEGGQIEQLSDFVLSNAFTEKSFDQWFMTTGVVLVSAIMAGILVMTVVGAPAGVALGLETTGYAMVVVSSGFMAAGSLVGAEIGREISGRVGDTALESNLMRCVEGEMEVGELLKNYGKEFVVSWASSMLFLAGGKFLLQGISSGMSKTAGMDMAYISATAEKLRLFAKAVRDFASRVSPPGGGPLGQTVLQVADEVKEEILEDIAQGVDPRLGFAVQLWNSLDGRNLDLNISGTSGITVVAQSSQGLSARSEYEYAAGSTDVLFEGLKKQYPEASVLRGPGGEITVRISGEIHGKTNQHVMQFNPTTESTLMRQTLRRSVGQNGELSASVLVTNYGVEFDAVSGGYTYDSLTSTGSAGLIPYLKRDGYIISRVKEDGSFRATKGETTVAFRSMGELDTESHLFLDGLLNPSQPDVGGVDFNAEFELFRNLSTVGDFEAQLASGLMTQDQLMARLLAPELVDSMFNDLLNQKTDRIARAYKNRFGGDLDSLNSEQQLARVLGFEGDFTFDQKRIILEAHFIGVAEGRHLSESDGDLHGYTPKDIRDKGRKLAEDDGDFNSNQRRILIEEAQMAGVSSSSQASSMFDTVRRVVGLPLGPITPTTILEVEQALDRMVARELPDSYNSIMKSPTDPWHDRPVSLMDRFWNYRTMQLIQRQEILTHFPQQFVHLEARQRFFALAAFIKDSSQLGSVLSMADTATQLSSGTSAAQRFAILSQHPDQSTSVKRLLSEGIFEFSEGRVVDGYNFYFGKIMKDNEGYLWAVAMVEEQGQLIPRFFYKSNSAGGWRGCPFAVLQKNGKIVYSKGSGRSYTQETKVVDGVREFLEANENRPIDLGRSIDPYLPTARTDQDMSRMKDIYASDVEVYNVQGSDIDQFQPGHGSAAFRAGWTGPQLRQRLGQMQYPDGFVPNFRNGWVDKYPFKHTILGDCHVYVYSAQMDGRPVEWHMAVDGQGRVWVETIRFAGVKANTFGNYEEVIDIGMLGAKPCEYKHDDPKSSRVAGYMQHGLTNQQAVRATGQYYGDYGVDAVDLPASQYGSFSADYVDQSPLLESLVPIRQFREVTGISRRAP